MVKAKENGELNNEEIIQVIEGMTVLQLSELVKALETRFGVSAAVAAPAAMAAQAGAAPAAAAEERTSFDVILTTVTADKKIQTIKVVRELTNLGLKEAKDLVEGVPKPLKLGVPKEEVESLKAKLEAVGAKVEVK